MNGSILIQDVAKYVKKRRVFEHVSMEIPSGSTFAIIGNMMEGKTTLLALIGNLIKPSAGTITYPEDKMPTFGAFIDDKAFIYHETVEENLTYKKMVLGIQNDSFVAEYIKRFGLENVEKRKVRFIAHEFKNRLGLALALMGGPEVILLDEPFADLQYQEIEAVKMMLREYQQHTNATIIFTASSQEGLDDFATHYAYISGGVMKKADTKEHIETDMPGYIKLVCSPLSEAKNVLNQMNIYSYQTKSDYILHIFEHFDAIEDIRVKLEEANVHVTEITLIKDNGNSFLK